jgi:hypothetical protein
MFKAIFVIAGVSSAIADGVCWRKAQGRGVGKPITTCEAGLEKDGELCYP